MDVDYGWYLCRLGGTCVDLGVKYVDGWYGGMGVDYGRFGAWFGGTYVD